LIIIPFYFGGWVLLHFFFLWLMFSFDVRPQLEVSVEIAVAPWADDMSVEKGEIF